MGSKIPLSGTITALITPFRDQGIDSEGLIKNINHQIASGVEGLLVLGTTGEAATLSFQEQNEVILIAVKETRGKLPLWVGTGSAGTKETIEKTYRAHTLGGDVALVVLPYYNKPTQEGIYRHFETLAKESPLPIVIYNVPSRTGISLEIHTLLRLAELPQIVGIKEASGNFNYTAELLAVLRAHFPHFKVFSGDDALTFPLICLGAIGVVSVVSNLLPSLVARSVRHALEGDMQQALALHEELFPLYKMAFIETNPVPIKTAMALSGRAAGECRLPLVPMQPENQKKLSELLTQMGLKK